MMAHPMILTLPSRLWAKLRRKAEDAGKNPDDYILELVQDDLSKQTALDEYVTWSTAIDLGLQHGRSWQSQKSAYNWVTRWNEKHPDGDPLHISVRWGKVRQGDLLRALEETKK
jgi:hypothetical protein